MSVEISSKAKARADRRWPVGGGRFPALRDPRYPVHKIADQLEPYLRVIVEKFHPAQHYPGGDLTHVGKNYETLRQQTGELVALIRESLPQYFTS